MSESPVQNSPENVGQTSQILVAALMMGQVMFAVVALIISQNKQANLGVFACLGAGFATFMIVTSIVMRKLMTAAPIRQIAMENPSDWRQPLAGVYRSKTIVANAMLEGAGFFNLVAYILESHWMSLAIVGCLLSLMAITFPSQTQFESWAEQVQREHSL